MSTKRFLGYDTGENGKLVINQEQAIIVERIYEEYLSGKTAEYIKRIFEKEGVKNWDGRAKNKGQIQQYHVEKNYEAIIDPLIWEASQLETARRKEYMKKFGLKSYATKPETNPYAGKIICAYCNKPYIRKTWKSGDGMRKVWQCQGRYKVKGIEGCSNRNVDESIIEQACDYEYNNITTHKK